MSFDIWSRNSYLKSIHDNPPSEIKSKTMGMFDVPDSQIRQGKFPLTNELLPVFQVPYGRSPEVDYNTLWAYFRASPELQSILIAISDDVISDGWTLKGGRNYVQRAEKFLVDNHAKQTFTSLLLDVLLTGDGYLWKDKVNPDDFRKSLSKVISKRYGMEYKSKFTDWIMKATEEDIFSTRKFIDVPSSTFKININEYGDVTEYLQRPINYTGQPVRFTTDQIIHFRLMRINGKVYGYSPSQSLITIMDVLDDIRDYARYYFRKGGVPNYMFILKDANTGDPDYKALNKAIELYSNLTHRYKNLVLTGDVEIKELNKLDHDMEFRQLAQYLTQVMVMLWSIPASRLSDMLVSAGMKGSGTSTQGYYRKISHIQDIFEEMINSQLLEEFKVKLEFNRTYLDDEVVETQVAMQMADALSKQQALLAPYGKKMTLEKLSQMLRIKEDELEDGEAEIEVPNERQGFKPKNELTSDPEKKIDDKNKQKIAAEGKSLSWQDFKEEKGLI